MPSATLMLPPEPHKTVPLTQLVLLVHTVYAPEADHHMLCTCSCICCRCDERLVDGRELALQLFNLVPLQLEVGFLLAQCLARLQNTQSLSTGYTA